MSTVAAPRLAPSDAGARLRAGARAIARPLPERAALLGVGGGGLGPEGQSGADVAGISGFSGRESEVSVAWLADMVRAGRIRWVLTDGGGGFGRDGRTGATTAMAAVAQTRTAVGSGGSSSTTTGTATGLYDCLGKADALARPAS